MWLYRSEYSSDSKKMTDCHVCLGQPCNDPLCSCAHVERCSRHKRICGMHVVSLSYVCEYVFEYLLNGHTIRKPLPLHSYLLRHFCHHCKHMTMIGDTCRERDHLSLNCGSARCGQSQTLAEVILLILVTEYDHWLVIDQSIDYDLVVTSSGWGDFDFDDFDLADKRNCWDQW